MSTPLPCFEMPGVKNVAAARVSPPTHENSPHTYCRLGVSNGGGGTGSRNCLRLFAYMLVLRLFAPTVTAESWVAHWDEPLLFQRKVKSVPIACAPDAPDRLQVEAWGVKIID